MGNPEASFKLWEELVDELVSVPASVDGGFFTSGDGKDHGSG